MLRAAFPTALAAGCAPPSDAHADLGGPEAAGACRPPTEVLG